MNAIFVKTVVNGLVLPFIFMLCWNNSLVDLFAIKEISFLQSLLINIMFNMIMRNRQDKSKENEEKEIKNDLLKLETLMEKYTERVRGIKNSKGEKENE